MSSDSRRQKEKNKKYLQKNGRPVGVRVQFGVPDDGPPARPTGRVPHKTQSQEFQRCVAIYLQAIRSSHRRRTPLPSAGQRRRQAGLSGELATTRRQKSSSLGSTYLRPVSPVLSGFYVPQINVVGNGTVTKGPTLPGHLCCQG